MHPPPYIMGATRATSCAMHAGLGLGFNVSEHYGVDPPPCIMAAMRVTSCAMHAGSLWMPWVVQ